MAMKYLGTTFDIHGGGEDLIFPHHECEIAQSEAATRAPFARYWLHNGFVNMGAEKMSKSLGNTLAIREVVKRHSPDALRLWMLGTHYRNPIEWSEERAQEAARALERLTRLVGDVQAFWPGASGAPKLPDTLRTFRERFEAAMDDDFNTPQALGAVFDLGRALYELAERAPTDPEAKAAFVSGVHELVTLMRALGLLEQGYEFSGPPPGVQRLVAERGEARKRRDWKRADDLRDDIQRLGWAVEDTPSGPRVTRKDA
jgi:cysteinyl-tRNA synthetase